MKVKPKVGDWVFDTYSLYYGEVGIILDIIYYDKRN